MTDKRFAGLSKLHQTALADFNTYARPAKFLVETPFGLVETFWDSHIVNHSLTMLEQLLQSVVTGEMVP
jgi:hypothetical protein